jgi:hypothetical protein
MVTRHGGTSSCMLVGDKHTASTAGTTANSFSLVKRTLLKACMRVHRPLRYFVRDKLCVMIAARRLNWILEYVCPEKQRENIRMIGINF